MEEELKNNFSINNPETFQWVRNQEIDFGEFGILMPDQREDEINAIIYFASLIYQSPDGKNAGEVNFIEVINFSCNNINNTVYCYCLYYLLKNGITVTNTIRESLFSKIQNQNLNEMFKSVLIERLRGENSDFELKSSISHFSLLTDENPIFIKKLCREYFTVNEEIEIKSGMIICDVTLLELISQKENSQVWKGLSKGKKEVAIKFENYEIKDKNMIKKIKNGNTVDINKFLRENDEDYLNYIKLKDYQNKVEYYNIQFFAALSMKVKIMSWLGDSIDKVPVNSKNHFLNSVKDNLYIINKLGYVYNNIDPSHIIYNEKENKYYFINFKYLRRINGNNTNLDGNYRALTLLENSGKVRIYDDIESLLYVFNDLFIKIEYSSIEDEIQSKKQLSKYISNISQCINYLRELSSNDQNFDSMGDLGEINNYVDSIYSHVNQIVESLTINEIPQPDFLLNKIDKVRLDNIMEQVLQDSRFQYLHNDEPSLIDFSLKVLNFMIKGTIYEAEIKHRIVEFLTEQ